MTYSSVGWISNFHGETLHSTGRDMNTVHAHNGAEYGISCSSSIDISDRSLARVHARRGSFVFLLKLLSCSFLPGMSMPWKCGSSIGTGTGTLFFSRFVVESRWFTFAWPEDIELCVVSSVFSDHLHRRPVLLVAEGAHCFGREAWRAAYLREAFLCRTQYATHHEKFTETCIFFAACFFPCLCPQQHCSTRLHHHSLENGETHASWAPSFPKYLQLGCVFITRESRLCTSHISPENEFVFVCRCIPKWTPSSMLRMHQKLFPDLEGEKRVR